MSESKLTQGALDQIDQYSRDRVGISTLERYTGSQAAEFQPFILLTNFKHYVDMLAERSGEPIRQGSVMQACHIKGEGISIINYSVGSPTAALVVELLSFIKPKGVLMLGMCGGLRDEHKVGDFFNPVAAIRGEGTSDAYMPKRCPSLASFVIQRFVCETLEKKKLSYHSGVIHTTNVRFWEFNEGFKELLTEERAQAIDMECATLFTVGFAKYVPVGALMLISDTPLKAAGIKTAASAKAVFEKHTGIHIEVGMQVLSAMRERAKEGLGYRF
ncbi:MAG: AMP nucleosidase [Deltaproteobacteria bacterium]|nr:AMP nucleosidase [Deltaproteobacteria bacterium]